MIRQGLSLALALGAAFAGCSKKPTDEAAPPPVAAPAPAASSGAQAARRLFDTTCAVCHGANGHGDGVAAAALNPKPRNYSDKAWQASVTDSELRAIIVQGGAAVGKSPTMPGQPMLKAQPEVVDALIAIIRDFGK
jgi:mono/diheme cytochrome c family protein